MTTTTTITTTTTNTTTTTELSMQWICFYLVIVPHTYDKANVYTIKHIFTLTISSHNLVSMWLWLFADDDWACSDRQRLMITKRYDIQKPVFITVGNQLQGAYIGSVSHPASQLLLLLLLLLQNLYSAQIQASSSQRRCRIARWWTWLAGLGKDVSFETAFERAIGWVVAWYFVE